MSESTLDSSEFGLGSLAILNGDRELAEPNFCLSFDDCRQNWLDVALPILRSFDIPATFFIVIDSICRGGDLTWQDRRECRRRGMRIGLTQSVISAAG